MSIGVCYLTHPASFHDPVIVLSSPTTCFSDVLFSLLVFLSDILTLLLLSASALMRV